MNWNILDDISTLEAIVRESADRKVMIFKHSTRCAISDMVITRLQRQWREAEMENKLKPYYLDLIQHRNISNEIAQRFGVMHESPQVLVIAHGACVYNASHTGINYADLQDLALSE